MSRARHWFSAFGVTAKTSDTRYTRIPKQMSVAAMKANTILANVARGEIIDEEAMVAALGNRVENIIVATAIINLPFYIRFARAEVNVRRNVGWVEAARACGDSHISVVLRFLLPNVLPAMAVQMSLNLGWAILNAAGLSFIGLGVRPPTPEWGIMVAEGARFISTGKWWLVAFPGLALMLAVLCFNLLGDGMRDILDPRMRT